MPRRAIAKALRKTVARKATRKVAKKAAKRWKPLKTKDNPLGLGLAIKGKARHSRGPSCGQKIRAAGTAARGGSTWGRAKAGAKTAWGKTKAGAKTAWGKTRGGAKTAWGKTKSGAGAAYAKGKGGVQFITTKTGKVIPIAKDKLRAGGAKVRAGAGQAWGKTKAGARRTGQWAKKNKGKATAIGVGAAGRSRNLRRN